MKFRNLVLLALVSSLVACGGSAGKEPAAGGHDDHHGAAGGGPLVPNGEAKVGDRTKCVVSGEEFVVKADSPKVEHGGKTYYLCCPHCADKFKADPEKFTGKSGS